MRGTILASEGEQLALHITAVDATGHEWLNSAYAQVVTDMVISTTSVAAWKTRIANGEGHAVKKPLRCNR